MLKLVVAVSPPGCQENRLGHVAMSGVCVMLSCQNVWWRVITSTVSGNLSLGISHTFTHSHTQIYQRLNLVRVSAVPTAA